MKLYLLVKKWIKKKLDRELDQCLSSEEEILSNDWKSGYSDEWPVERMMPEKV